MPSLLTDNRVRGFWLWVLAEVGLWVEVLIEVGLWAGVWSKVGLWVEVLVEVGLWVEVLVEVGLWTGVWSKVWLWVEVLVEVGHWTGVWFDSESLFLKDDFNFWLQTKWGRFGVPGLTTENRLMMFQISLENSFFVVFMTTKYTNQLFKSNFRKNIFGSF
jgi:hypothetical protein